MADNTKQTDKSKQKATKQTNIITKTTTNK